MFLKWVGKFDQLNPIVTKFSAKKLHKHITQGTSSQMWKQAKRTRAHLNHLSYPKKKSTFQSELWVPVEERRRI
ncbi:hypothetical protein GBAR_LOCUS23559 [Geodia barretti]|uniref:Uncharacterized protein n=1 Tax=Geodia barretti TaxID=519541 RepID=A0AA35X8Q9_GEOBA|nr:hypothetical protein GBAR_LOCUS23559 [Geodia barretti]